VRACAPPARPWRRSRQASAWRVPAIARRDASLAGAALSFPRPKPLPEKQVTKIDIFGVSGDVGSCLVREPLSHGCRQ
jgi:hypothetical protein